MSCSSIDKKDKLALYIDGSATMAGKDIQNAVMAAYGLSGPQTDIYLVSSSGLSKVSLASYDGRRRIEKNVSASIGMNIVNEMAKQSQAYGKAYFITNSALSQDAFKAINPLPSLKKVVMLDAPPHYCPPYLKSASVEIVRRGGYVSDIIIKDLAKDRASAQLHEDSLALSNSFNAVQKNLVAEIKRLDASLQQKTMLMGEYERMIRKLLNEFERESRDKRKAEKALAELRADGKKTQKKR